MTMPLDFDLGKRALIAGFEIRVDRSAFSLASREAVNRLAGYVTHHEKILHFECLGADRAGVAASASASRLDDIAIDSRHSDDSLETPPKARRREASSFERSPSRRIRSGFTTTSVVRTLVEMPESQRRSGLANHRPCRDSTA